MAIIKEPDGEGRAPVLVGLGVEEPGAIDVCGADEVSAEEVETAADVFAAGVVGAELPEVHETAKTVTNTITDKRNKPMVDFLSLWNLCQLCI